MADKQNEAAKPQGRVTVNVCLGFRLAGLLDFKAGNEVGSFLEKTELRSRERLV